MGINDTVKITIGVLDVLCEQNLVLDLDQTSEAIINHHQYIEYFHTVPRVTIICDVG